MTRYQKCGNCLLCFLLWFFCGPLALLYFCFLKCFSNDRPRAKNIKPKVSSDTITGNFNLIKQLQKTASCFFYRCCCSLNFTANLTLAEAISRYEEDPPQSLDELVKELCNNKLVGLFLRILNEKQPKYFFKILPSGSLRERLGKTLPSTSILASDFDLMLVPDSVQVRDAEQMNITNQMADNVGTSRPENFPPTFLAFNENPNTPTGYLWLKLVEPELKHWLDLCYDRLTYNGIESYLSQLAVYNLIESQMIKDETVNTIMKLCESVDIVPEVNRSGPALTVVFKEKSGKEIFHVDFTFAIHCPNFPTVAESYFTLRENYKQQTIFWPNYQVLQKIRKVGCHVVPKPSEKASVFITREQVENSSLSQVTTLEWRYSFSQAEMILSDNLPPPARSAFLAFKATVKMHINYKPDGWGKFHEMPSYVMKTILFKEVQNKQPGYWETNEVVGMFLEMLFNHLQEAVATRSCPMFWIPSINLLAEKDDEDFNFFQYKLNIITENLERFVADDWLECQRCLRLNCCSCCYPGAKDSVKIEKNMSRRACCRHLCHYSENTCCCGPIPFDGVEFDVY